MGDNGAGAYINLEGGLAITLNLEISPQDPSGVTAPYKLLVPALHYNGTEYDPPPAQIVKGWRKFLPRRKKNGEAGGRPEADDYSDDEQDDYEDYDLINNTRANAATSQQHQPQYEGYPGSEEEDGDSEGEVPQRPPRQVMAEQSPSSEEHSRPRKKKWFGVI